MEYTKFECQIQAAHQRLATIQQQASHSQPLKQLLEEATVELATALEELHVSSEELHSQNQELLETRQSLAQEHQRYQELFEFAPDAYLVTDIQSLIEEANNAATTLLNVPNQYLVGKPLSLYIAESERHSFRTQLKSLRSSVQEIKEWEITLQPREAEPFPVAISVSTRTDSKGEILGWRWLLRDLRERQQAEATLRELEIQKHLNQFKTSLLGSISHEFRTPLNIILMSVGMIERNLHTHKEEHKQRVCQRMRIAVYFLTQLLEQVEFYHHAYTSDPTLNTAIIELEPFCRHIIQEMQQFAADDREIRFTCDSSSFSFRFDAKLLQQVLRNSLSNALKYSSAEKPIRFEARCLKEKIVFQIQDWGIGIPEEDKPQIFEPFYRGSNIDAISGVGLGLAVVKKAVDSCQGEIFFESKVDFGTTFTAILPLQ